MMLKCCQQPARRTNSLENIVRFIGKLKIHFYDLFRVCNCVCVANEQGTFNPKQSLCVLRHCGLHEDGFVVNF